MCVFVKLWHWTSGPGWRPARIVCVDLSAWAVLMTARGYWKAKGMCVWAGNSCSPPSNDYLCSLCLIYGHTWSLHALMDLQQDRQDAVNVLNTPDDKCVHFVQGAPLINYLDVSFKTLLVFPWQKKKKKKKNVSVFAQTLGSSLLIVCVPHMLCCCASVHICFHWGSDVQHILLIRGRRSLKGLPGSDIPGLILPELRVCCCDLIKSASSKIVLRCWAYYQI